MQEGTSSRQSLRMLLARAAVRTLRGRTRSPDALWREYGSRSQPSPARVTRALRRVAEVREDRIGDRPVFRVSARSNPSPWHVVYTHGGCFVDPLHWAHWDLIAALVRATGASVSVPIYPLAPEHTYTNAFGFLEQVYRELSSRVAPNRIVLCGDSAGGNLVLAQALRYRELGMPLPARLVLFAPWLDLRLSNPEAHAIEPRDVMLRCAELVEFGRWWSGATDPRSPALSPLFAELGGLPPIDIFQGTDDVFAPDAERFCAKVRSAGGVCELHLAAGAIHDYMVLTFTPEAKRVFEALAETLRSL